uniref:Uncharacterized protein n=1 Tax=Tanacetum cinerariifolium TaxID=118510 RepID=A0A6L2MQN0_TANCI|nr:hypothetical protein [Tanacetum cinerariifolium]
METRLMVIIVKDVLFYERNLRKICLHIVFENGILQDFFEPYNDNTNVVNALQEPFVVKQDPDKYSLQSPSQINHHCCYGCGDPLEDIFCRQCTCESCGKGSHYGYNCPSKVPITPDPEPFNNQTIDELPQTLPSFDPTCYSEDGNLFTYDSKSNLVDDSPNIFNHPPQTPTYSYEFCWNDAYSGHDCPLQVPFNYDPEPCYNQDFNFPQKFYDFQQQYLCCENCGGPHKAYQCKPMNEDYYHEQNSCYDPNSFGFDQFQPPHYTEEEKQIKEEQAAKARYWKIPVCYDDDDEDYNIAITLKELDSSLSTGDEHLDTIPATESDEFIKSSVENLVPNPNIPKEIFSNPLFDEEINSMKIDLHHFNAESDLIESLFNHDSSIISSFSKIDSLFDEFAEEFISKNSDTAFESFSPFPIPVEDSDSFMEEIDLNFTLDDLMPSSIEEDDYDSERDILILLAMIPFHILKMSHFILIFLHRLGHEAFQPSTECPMMIYGRNTPILDVLFLHFYPLDKLKYRGLGQA